MAMKTDLRNVFISFDAEDESMVNLLRSQAKDERFPFEFRDYSVKEPFEARWKSEVRNLISMSSAVIVAIGRNTHESSAVNWEIEEAHRQGKIVIGVWLHRDPYMYAPSAMSPTDPIIPWNTEEIADMLEYESDDWP